MRFPFKHLSLLPVLLLAVATAGCSLVSRKPAVAQPPAPSYDLVAAIRAAGAANNSVIDVQPLRDPAAAALSDAAHQDEQAGEYADAASALDQALKISPDSPDLLQDRAEIAVRLKHFSSAEKLAHQSWALGPKLGPLCARNWQTIVETRLQVHDQVGAATARKWVQQCHKAGVPRY
ncbi:MAG: tetratricopeptide repeat protein [Rhodanobacter sp.]|nr:MAG: tetratricopeptide repeat protein [Rhodanobacter sp.]TAM01878.1 MAG: tetratricopeptide repeat protein [Rhodanobacter sp.]TAM39852.1 MAG: tetratricopeptide repeat protein [Rhodanobacter sp.]TAN23422.1 MAG: tetratricopeptide repeat protein [Rhodanobacter sp.]